MTMLLCFYGLPRSGKDTAAEHLATKRKIHRVSFGAGIYEEVAKSFGVSTDQLASHEWKTEPMNALCIIDSDNGDFIDAVMAAEIPDGATTEEIEDFLTQPRTSRYILQRWATEYRRKQDPLYWVKKLDDTLKHKIRKEGRRDIVVSDLREFHEYTYLQNLSGARFIPMKVVEVVRPGTTSNGHSSDNALPKWCIDRQIVNTNIDQFRSDVEQVVEELFNPSKEHQ